MYCLSARTHASVCVGVHLPPAPFQNALKPSSLRIFRKQSMSPLYVVWPARAATWSLVLMTSAGVTSEAAGTPEETSNNGQNQGLLFCPERRPQGSSGASRRRDKSWRANYNTTAELSRCLLPAIAPAASSCKGPSFPSSSAIFSLLWA